MTGRVLYKSIYNKLFFALLGVALISACTSAPRYRSAPAAADEGAVVAAERAEIIEVARSYLGTPYRSGGSSRTGVDCSGFVAAVYRQFDIPLPRTSLNQATTGLQVSRSELQPADLIFFKTSRRKLVSHVGIYVGRGKFIHASTEAHRVRIDHMDD
ncbi:MAG: C40 family peptidase, partial [Candidatus Latescibacterota bacterium]